MGAVKKARRGHADSEGTIGMSYRAIFPKGTVVRIRSEQEIERALTSEGTVEGVPFTYEHRLFCDSTHEVLSEVRSILVEGYGQRRIKDVYLLKGATCSGVAHRGCQRNCLLFFRREWLEKPGTSETGQSSVESLRGSIPAGSRYTAGIESGNALPSCQGQGDLLVRATIPWAFDIWQRIGQIFRAEIGIGEFMSVMLFLWNKLWDIEQPVWKLSTEKFGKAVWVVIWFLLRQNIGWRFKKFKIRNLGSEQSKSSKEQLADITEKMQLQPGERVRVRSREEIIATLGPNGKNRGLSFVGSMLKYCKREYTVMTRVERVIDERTSKLKTLTGSVMLEGVICDGVSYRGCQRKCLWIWRDDWLERL